MHFKICCLYPESHQRYSHQSFQFIWPDCIDRCIIVACQVYCTKCHESINDDEQTYRCMGRGLLYVCSQCVEELHDQCDSLVYSWAHDVGTWKLLEYEKQLSVPLLCCDNCSYNNLVEDKAKVQWTTRTIWGLHTVHEVNAPLHVACPQCSSQHYFGASSHGCYFEPELGSEHWFLACMSSLC
jgi:hypothetical protein